jgi:hypothetical protein
MLPNSARLISDEFNEIPTTKEMEAILRTLMPH